MRQGLGSAEDGILSIKTKLNKQRKLPHGGKTQLAIWQAGQEKAGQDQDTVSPVTCVSMCSQCFYAHFLVFPVYYELF